jgi:hypothetical protein
VCLTAVASAKASGIMTSRFDSTNDEERGKACSSVAVVLSSLKGVPRLFFKFASSDHEKELS